MLGDAWILREGLWSSRAVTIAAGAALCAIIALLASGAGPGAALVAGGLSALLPGLLAHGHLATLDVLLALFFTVACAATEAFGKRPGVGRAAVIAVAVGLVVSTKWTGLVLVPALPVAVWPMGASRRERRRISVAVLAASLAGVLLSVCFCAATIGLSSLAEGFAFQMKHARDGHAVVFLGQLRIGGSPIFYAVSLALATPLALWPLLALGTRAVLHRAPLWVPPLALAVVLSFTKVQLGLRYVLPVYPPLLVGAGAGFAALWRRDARLPALMLVAAFVTSSLAYVSHLPYRNELRFLSRWRGLEWLAESDGDWGQGGPALAADVERLEVNTLCIAWYGAPLWRREPELVRRVTGPDTCEAGAVGAFLLFSDDRFAPLRTRAPLNPGGTVFLFDLKGAPDLARAWLRR
jgi:4-amino-4-deoxy-L-arabinose transferase-like glycosyltransferase